MLTAEKQTGNNAIDFHSEAFFSDPYPFYRQLRELGTPYWLTHSQLDSQSPGMWLFGRYAEVAEILKATTSISKQIIRVRAPERRSPMDFNLLNQDPPSHTRLRNLMSHAFTPRRIRQLEPWIGNVVDGLIARMGAQDHADFIADFAGPLPVMVIAQLLGIPLEDQEKFRGWSVCIMVGYDSVVAKADVLERQKTALQEVAAYFNWLIDQRRAEPQDDLISAMIAAQNEPERLTGDELVGMCILLLIAGHETTTHLLGNGLLTLLQHPQQRELLRQQPDYLLSAIEEMLRFESPTQRGTFRITTQPCVIGGKEFAAGEQICAVIGSANRDPDKFPEPDAFDITRSPNQHLSFGLGIHFCIGATLARAEARIGFERILARFPDIRLAEQTQEWNISTLFRGLRTLPVML